MKEKAYRSLIKTISWRTVGTIDTIIIAYFIVGDVTAAFSIGAIELFTKMGLYYFHERAWNKINIGREKPVEYNI